MKHPDRQTQGATPRPAGSRFVDCPACSGEGCEHCEGGSVSPRESEAIKKRQEAQDTEAVGRSITPTSGDK